MTTYTFNEPEVASFSREQVCFRLFTGQIDQQLIFQVSWNPITAAQGIPGQGGDYVPQSTTYTLNPGTQLNCIDILIQRDNAFERREEFQGEIVSIQLPDGRIVPSFAAINILPRSTRVFIDNTDGKAG